MSTYPPPDPSSPPDPASYKAPPGPESQSSQNIARTMTESQPIAGGETWNAQLDGLALPALTLRVAR